LGPGTANDWHEVGDAFNVTALFAHRDGWLYCISNNKMWRRGNIGPGTGNDWKEAGEAYGVHAAVGRP
jgi:hypothetical protein